MTALTNMDGSIAPISRAVHGDPSKPGTLWGRPITEDLTFVGDLSAEIAEIVAVIRSLRETSRKIPFYEDHFGPYDAVVGKAKIQFADGTTRIEPSGISIRQSYAEQGWPSPSIIDCLKADLAVDKRFIRFRDELIAGLEVLDKITVRINESDGLRRVLGVPDDRTLQMFRATLREEPRYVETDPEYHLDVTPDAFYVTGANDGITTENKVFGKPHEGFGVPVYEPGDVVSCDEDEVSVLHGMKRFHTRPFRNEPIHRTSFLSVLVPAAIGNR